MRNMADIETLMSDLLERLERIEDNLPAPLIQIGNFQLRRTGGSLFILHSGGTKKLNAAEEESLSIAIDSWLLAREK